VLALPLLALLVLALLVLALLVLALALPVLDWWAVQRRWRRQGLVRMAQTGRQCPMPRPGFPASAGCRCR